MANEEQLSILKLSINLWNRWRKENPHVEIDLSEATLSEINLERWITSSGDLWRANLSEANLKDAKLNKTDLKGAYLDHASLWNANLRSANLAEADISGAFLDGADLSDAQLSRAEPRVTHLNGVDFSRAILSDADLTNSSLMGAYFIETNVSGCSFLGATIGVTVFSHLDLSNVIGLEEVGHRFPSSISTDVIAHSKGKLPEIFLRGCGLPDWEVEGVKLHNPDLSNDEVNRILYRMYDLRATQALQISPLFISYSHADSPFVEQIETHLNRRGIRFWRDIHDMKAGRMEKQIDRAIRQNPTVLLVLSEHSLRSDWVEHEVRTARGLEKEMGRDVLCPVALDHSWKDSRWPKRVMEQIMEYNILDFSQWRDDSKFEDTFLKLIDGLELFYKG